MRTCIPPATCHPHPLPAALQSCQHGRPAPVSPCCAHSNNCTPLRQSCGPPNTLASTAWPDCSTTAGLQQSTQQPGTWTVHIWQRGALVRRSVAARGQHEVLELLDACRSRAEWLSLPVYFQASGALRDVISGGLAGGAGARHELQENEEKLKMQLQRRFRGAPRVVQTVRGAAGAELACCYT